jgi:hypothetical protein
VHYTDRGGEVTFHGPGQWVCYPVYHLRDLKVGARTFIRRLERSMTATVGTWGLQATGDISTAAGVRSQVAGKGLLTFNSMGLPCVHVCVKVASGSPCPQCDVVWWVCRCGWAMRRLERSV